MGFDFIEANGTRSNARNEQLRWITKQLNDKSSPVFRFQRATIQQALDNLKSASLQVRTQTEYPITMMDFDPIFAREVVPLLVPKLRTHACGFLGKHGVGKTPVMCAMQWRFLGLRFPKRAKRGRRGLGARQTLTRSKGKRVRLAVRPFSMTAIWIHSPPES